MSVVSVIKPVSGACVHELFLSYTLMGNMMMYLFPGAVGIIDDEVFSSLVQN